jgi:hypothetical protein
MNRRVPATVRARKIAAITGLAALSSCSELGVTNLNAPGIDLVFSTPAAVEQTIASGYQSCSNATLTLGEGALVPQLAALSLEGYTSAGNFAMGVRVGIPRQPISNTLGSPSILADYSRLALGGRLAANAVTALDRITARGATLGTDAQDLRARAFGFFAVGCHQGWLGMAFDSAAIVSPGIAGDSIPPLSGAREVMAAAIAMLDTAITIASHPAARGPGGFPLPAHWLAGNALNDADFVRLVRSLRARFRAGVARTPEEREALDWNAIIADAEAGVATDFTIAASPTAGWFVNANAFLAGPFLQASPMYYGMADVSGGYDAWLSLPPDQRQAFLVITPDMRWPQGETRTEQRANSVVPASLISRPYLANRIGVDPPGHPWGVSQYYFDRLAYIRNSSNVGAFPSITRVELDLLAAEGYLRGGNVAAAAAKIDITRVGRGELPALTGVVTGVEQPVPGDAMCVPRVPAPPLYTSTVCGNIWEALKWEKRMETAFTGVGQWFFDSRGWGDLIEHTALEFPVPFEEMVARRRSSYPLGGGLESSARRGTYGF